MKAVPRKWLRAHPEVQAVAVRKVDMLGRNLAVVFDLELAGELFLTFYIVWGLVKESGWFEAVTGSIDDIVGKRLQHVTFISDFKRFDDGTRSKLILLHFIDESHFEVRWRYLPSAFARVVVAFGTTMMGEVGSYSLEV